MQSYATITLIISAVALVTGLLLLVSPGLLIRAGEFFNRVYNLESVVYAQRKPFGLAFILFGALLIYTLW